MRPSDNDDRTRGYIILGFVLTLIAVVLWVIYNAVTKAFAKGESEKRMADAEAKAAEAAARASQALAAKEAACRADPSAPGCSSLPAERDAADAAAKAAAAAAKERARASAPCAEWEDAGRRGDPPVACRIWRIENGETDECMRALAEQPVWGKDFANDAVDKAYAAHAVKYCPIKAACLKAGVGFKTRPVYGRIFEPNEGCS